MAPHGVDAARHRAPSPRGGVSTWLLRFTHRGWNGGPARIADARAALDDVRRQLGDIPVVLLGHSMGARTAVHVADDPSVRGVVALAPWLPPGEPVEALRGKQLYAAHGSRDRITSARATAAYVRRAAAVASTAEFHDMGPVGHYLLRARGSWNAFAVEAALRVLENFLRKTFDETELFHRSRWLYGLTKRNRFVSSVREQESP